MIKPRPFLYYARHSRVRHSRRFGLRKRGQKVRIVRVQIVRVPCEVYSRIVGYLRPTMNWNKGKLQEFAERRPYRVSEEGEMA